MPKESDDAVADDLGTIFSSRPEKKLGQEKDFNFNFNFNLYFINSRHIFFQFDNSNVNLTGVSPSTPRSNIIVCSPG